MMRLAIACAVVVVPSSAIADDSNFRPYIIGARAAGMGGAFTALADDGSGAYYNPGGVAFAQRSSLSLSASVYGFVTGSFGNALGAGKDFHFSDLNTFPVSTGIVRKFGSRDTPDGSQANAIAISIFVPDAFQIDDHATGSTAQNVMYLSDVEQTLWAGVTYSRRIGRLGVGASVFGLLGSQTTFLDVTTAKDAMTFGTLTQRTDISTKGLVGSVGVRYDPTDALHLGLSLFSPELGYGSRRIFARGASGSTAGPQIIEISADDLHATPTLPFRVQTGIAWTSGGFTLAADAILLGPRSEHDDADRAAEGLDRRVVRNAVVDASIGAELVLAKAFALRAGAFTDFAQAGEPLPHAAGMPDPNASNSGHVDRYGATLAFGYRTEHSATNVGGIVTYGSGHDTAPVNGDFSNIQPTTATQLYAYVFVASTYEF